MFENSSKIVIVMEYASKGDLYDYISERQRLSEQEARHFFRQVVSAVYYCHKVGWHRASRRFPGDFPAGERLDGLLSAPPCSRGLGRGAAPREVRGAGGSAPFPREGLIPPLSEGCGSAPAAFGRPWPRLLRCGGD